MPSLDLFTLCSITCAKASSIIQFGATAMHERLGDTSAHSSNLTLAAGVSMAAVEHSAV